MSEIPENKQKMRFKLQANDGTIIEVEEDVAFQCLQIKQMTEDLGITDPNDVGLQDPIRVSQLDGNLLKKLMDWCTEHRAEEPKRPEAHARIAITDKDEELMNVSNDELIKILTAADFLDIPGVVGVITQKIANMGRGLNTDAMREAFNLRDDPLAPEEVAEVMRDVDWINS